MMTECPKMIKLKFFSSIHQIIPGEQSLHFRAQVKSFITVVYKHSDVPLLWLE